jgi:pentatricopeptide repeat protein
LGRHQQQLRNANCSISFSTSTNTTTPTTETDPSAAAAADLDFHHPMQRYLSPEEYPLGSFDVKIVEEISKSIEHLVEHAASPKQVLLSFELLDRLLQDVPHVHYQIKQQLNNNHNKTNNSQQPPPPVPSTNTPTVLNTTQCAKLQRRVIGAWRDRWRDQTTDVTPQMIFETLKRWEAYLLPHYPHVHLPFRDVVHATAKTLPNPALAQQVVEYMMRDDNQFKKYSKSLQTACNRVLEAWAQQNDRKQRSEHEPFDERAPRQADKIVRSMIHWHEQLGFVEMAPNQESYIHAIAAWTNMTSHNATITATAITAAAQRADQLLRDMQARGFLPNKDTFHNVLTAWTRSDDPSAPEQAYALLNHMIDLYGRGAASAKPNIYCYLIVMNAFVKRGNVYQAERVLLELLDRFSVTRDEAFRPCAAYFHALIRAWSDPIHNIPQAPQLAEAVLQRMQQVSKEYQDKSLWPDTECFHHILRAWVNSPHKHAPQRCEKVFQRMQYWYENNGYDQCQPNVDSLNFVIDCWVKASPQQAEAFLRRTEQEAGAFTGNVAQHKKSGVRPNIDSYNKVLNVWAHSDHSDSAERTQALFDDILNKYNKGYTHLKPTLQTFKALVTSRRSGKGAEKAQAAFDDMWARYQAGDEELKPDAAICNALIGVWGRAGQPQKAERLLRDMEETLGVKPNIITYNQVIHGWSRSGLAEAGERAQRLFDELQQKYEDGNFDLKPDERSYGMLLVAWARTNTLAGAEKAQAIFNDMMARYQSGDKRLKPNLIVYHALINAWAKADSPDKSEEIFRQMESDGVKLNTACYNAVMNAWCQSNLSKSGPKAQALFDEFLQKCRYGNANLFLAKPDSQTYTALITAWGGSRPDGAAKAQAVFDDLVSRYQSDNKMIKPSIDHYVALIDAWGKAGVPEKAEQILQDLNSNHPNESESSAYYAAIDAWALSESSDAGDRIKVLIDEMVQKQNANVRKIKPTLKAYRTLIKAWGNSRTPDDAAKAQAVFDDLRTTDDYALRPRALELNYLLNAWGKAGVPERAEQLLREMESNTAEPRIKPDVFSYIAVMTSWSRSGSAEAIERVQNLFDELQQKYNDGENDLKPTVYVYATLMSAWGRQNSPDSAARAQAVFDDMLVLYKDGDENLKPRIVHYNCMMDAWERAGNPETAEEILREINLTNPYGLKPDMVSYFTLINAWCKRAEDDPGAIDRAQSLYDELQQKFRAGEKRLKPEPLVYEALVSAWCNCSRDDAVVKAEAVLDDLLALQKEGETEWKPLIDKFIEMIEAKRQGSEPDLSNLNE